MRVVDGADGQPVAGAKVTFCSEAWEGTLTGHGGKRQMLFRLEATTDACGAFSLPARPFDSRPFGFSTNFEHALLVVDKAGYEPQRLINCCAKMGSEDPDRTQGGPARGRGPPALHPFGRVNAKATQSTTSTANPAMNAARRWNTVL